MAGRQSHGVVLAVRAWRGAIAAGVVPSQIAHAKRYGISIRALQRGLKAEKLPSRPRGRPASKP